MPDVKPITPEEARGNKKLVIPNEVIQVVNEMLVRELRSDCAMMYQEDIIAEVLKRMPHLTSSDVYKNKYLDFEPLFEAQGWDVKYDSPAYGESFRAHFIFTAKLGRR